MYDPTYRDRSWIYRVVLVVILAAMLCGLWILMQPPPPIPPVPPGFVVIK